MNREWSRDFASSSLSPTRAICEARHALGRHPLARPTSMSSMRRSSIFMNRFRMRFSVGTSAFSGSTLASEKKRFSSSVCRERSSTVFPCSSATCVSGLIREAPDLSAMFCRR